MINRVKTRPLDRRLGYLQLADVRLASPLQASIALTQVAAFTGALLKWILNF